MGVIQLLSKSLLALLFQAFRNKYSIGFLQNSALPKWLWNSSGSPWTILDHKGGFLHARSLFH